MIPTPISLESYTELDALVLLLKAGDMNAKNKIITGFIKIAQQIAFNWHKRTQRSLDALEAEALYLLTLAVNKAKTKLVDNNIGPYINTYISKNLLKYMYRHRYISASKEKIKKLKIIIEPSMLPLSQVKISTYWEEDSFLTMDDILLMDTSDMNRRDMEDLLEVIDYCVRTDEEKTIFKYRLMGYKSPEIAELSGIHRRRVDRIRETIEFRFRKELE